MNPHWITRSHVNKISPHRVGKNRTKAFPIGVHFLSECLRNATCISLLKLVTFPLVRKCVVVVPPDW